MRSLRAINLNLLPPLQVLLRFRQVSRAAKALNMSQSSVSEVLGALRHLSMTSCWSPREIACGSPRSGNVSKRRSRRR